MRKGKKTLNVVREDYFQNCVNENGLDKLYKYYCIISEGLRNNHKDEILEYLEKGKKEFNNVYKSKHYLLSGEKSKDTSVYVNFLHTLIKGKKLTSVFNVGIEHWNYKHPTQKPLELMSRIVKLVSNEDDIILDCFAGSGSTLLGAIKNNRNYIGIEIDKEYYDICCDRIKEKQGLFAGV